MSPKDTNRSVEMLSDKYASLSQSVNELSSKIDHLLTRNVNLQMEVDSALESNSPTTINPTSVAFNVVDELRFSSTWKRIYIQPDMTPSEREAHKLLYNQLQTRRSQGESNLIIRNGKIVTYIPGQYKSHVLVNNQTATSAHPTTAPGNESDTHS